MENPLSLTNVMLLLILSILINGTASTVSLIANTIFIVVGLYGASMMYIYGRTNKLNQAQIGLLLTLYGLVALGIYSVLTSNGL